VRRLREAGIGRQSLIASSIGGLIVLADVLTKRWAASSLVSDDMVVIPGFLEFRFRENPGAAFSLFQDAGPILGVAAVVVLGFVTAALGKPRAGHEVVALGLVIGGAIGNLIDRIFRGEGFLDGKVVDWVQLSVIPTFNLADAAITMAVATFVLGSWRR
jgi:signal peptidase II